MGNINEHFYLFDSAFTGLQVPKNKLHFSGETGTLNITDAEQMFFLTWSDDTLKKLFTPGKSAGFFFVDKSTETNMQEVTKIAIFSDDRKTLATKALVDKGIGEQTITITKNDVRGEATMPPNAVFLTVASNEAQRIAYYQTDTGDFTFTTFANLFREGGGV